MKMQHHPAFVAPVLEIVQYMVIMDNVNTIYVLAQYMVYGPHFSTEHDICSKVSPFYVQQSNLTC